MPTGILSLSWIWIFAPEYLKELPIVRLVKLVTCHLNFLLLCFPSPLHITLIYYALCLAFVSLPTEDVKYGED